MKSSHIPIFLAVMVLIFAGCSKDDNGNGGDGDGEFVQGNLMVITLESGPAVADMEDVDDPVWSQADSLEVRIGFDPDYGQNSSLYDDTLMLKAIKTSTMIYIRAQWKDNTGNLRGKYIRKLQGTGLWEHVWKAEASGGDDGLFIMFDNGNGTGEDAEGADCASMCHAQANQMATNGGGTVDMWSWRASTTAPAKLAEDQWANSNGNFVDPIPINPDKAYIDNWNSSFLKRPLWMHENDTTFHGLYLYVDDTVEFDANPDIGWDEVTGYIMPGHVIDTNVYKIDPPQNQWNVHAIFKYDSLNVPRTYTVVMSRPLVTDYSSGASRNDVDLSTVDSVQVSLAAANNHTNAQEDDSWVEHSGSRPFYLVFHRAD